MRTHAHNTLPVCCALAADSTTSHSTHQWTLRCLQRRPRSLRIRRPPLSDPKWACSARTCCRRSQTASCCASSRLPPWSSHTTLRSWQEGLRHPRCACLAGSAAAQLRSMCLRTLLHRRRDRSPGQPRSAQLGWWLAQRQTHRCARPSLCKAQVFSVVSSSTISCSNAKRVSTCSAHFQSVGAMPRRLVQHKDVPTGCVHLDNGALLQLCLVFSIGRVVANAAAHNV